jgi:hypothetical protein
MARRVTCKLPPDRAPLEAFVEINGALCLSAGVPLDWTKVPLAQGPGSAALRFDETGSPGRSCTVALRCRADSIPRQRLRSKNHRLRNAGPVGRGGGCQESRKAVVSLPRRQGWIELRSRTNYLRPEMSVEDIGRPQ